ncbi:D-2-hydroxyacid dehydrogenase [Caldivirga maquilingensis]|uniref:D-isomer specific 2-hydroxyacid dehydrogenase NAD-binding n=1 Tax=Caldivirga maquilingensis (strain ATCC 700844 / DSM 13496 / JCM 10307 / IC-167) TaxID=397948 RepID=A8MCX1_CALMQ|nr:D-2-hydroxyacid dehydrogenase [Caldivirga maquilingensis]ABW01627.1 D-isomer specific 2-hydroxyacid dehydrogenase NAD-binding [Caldivirga maquilingensis IC-167]
MGRESGIQYRALITDKIDERLINKLSEMGVAVDYKPGIQHEELLKIVENYDILVVRSRTKVTREVIDRGASLKIIARAGVGLDNIDVDYALKRGLTIVNSPNAATYSAAELTLSLMLIISRNLHLHLIDVKNGKWSKGLYHGIELRGKTLGVVGFGRIGRAVANYAKALGMRILATDVVDISRYAEELGASVVSLTELLSRSDVVTLHVALNKETYHMLNDDRLKLIKDNAIIVNTSRGEVIDTKALLNHLDRLWGVGLDVLEHEPPREDWEIKLIQHPKVVVTPHIGAETIDAQGRIVDELVFNIQEALERVRNHG